MFTGIIEAFGKVVNLEKDQQNLHLSLESRLTQELKIDQSFLDGCNGVSITQCLYDCQTHAVVSQTLVNF